MIILFLIGVGLAILCACASEASNYNEESEHGEDRNPRRKPAPFIMVPR